MKSLVIVFLVAIVAIIVWQMSKKSNVTTSIIKAKKREIQTIQDEPIDFGYKINWIAVKTSQREELANALMLKNTQPANWESGLEHAYDDCVFMTPQIGDWILIVGMGLMPSDSLESLEKIDVVLNSLSKKFGEAQFFGTHRIVEYHNWMKSVNGQTERIYAYIGESCENIKVYGEPTEPELGLKLFNSLSEEAKLDEYWEREDLDYADEELVMKVAEYWSVNPCKLSERDDIKKELGWIAY